MPTHPKMPRHRPRFSFVDIQTMLENVSFIHLHYFYFCATCMLASIVFWGSSTPAKSVRYIDSLYLCISAMTEAGLNTVNLSTLNTWQQVILFLLIIMGSAIFVSIAILHVRKRAFEKKFAELIEKRRRRLRRPRSLTFSWSKRNKGAADDHEAAVASGAVRGRAIQDPPQDVHIADEASMNPPERIKSRSDDTEDEAPVASDMTEVGDGDQNSHIRFPDQLPAVDHGHNQVRSRNLSRRRTSFFEGRGVGARALDNHPRNTRPNDSPWLNESAVEDEVKPSGNGISKLDKYLDTVNGYLGRNSQFHGLSEKERKKLGGIEYDAICLLSWVVPLYFILFQLFGALGVGAWMQVNRPGMARRNGENPFWTGAFFAISAFNNSGMALLDANATALQTSYYSLLTLSLLILAGNTCFPPFLRLILWTMKKFIPKDSPSLAWRTRQQTLEFCLDHPRRVYTNLFPSAQNWWLVFSLVMLNGIDWVAFELLNIGNPTTDAIAPHYRALDGLFQAFAVRSGGFYVVNIAGLRSGLLVLYVIMMYISAFPIALTIRNTNVYEERSLGIYAEDIAEQEKEKEEVAEKSQNGGDANGQPGRKFLSGLGRTLTMTHGQAKAPKNSSWTRQDFLRQQLRGQLGHDLWWLVLAIFMITAIETGQFERDPVVFSTFNIIFEVVSAYGCVGISTGVPWNAYSFSGAWHTASKLVLCAVMLRGRHRGLPVSIDRAILLPDETLAWAEEEDATKRRGSFGNATTAPRTSREGLRRPRTADSGTPGPSFANSGPGHMV
ncbi:cation transport protein-domain-containing protein [Exophiala viscosa]|uniref:Potassium transport protein n=1 Tax=Exophiala viscosa TaxID=2486360 RepID=A0AAN6E0M5_9EURO|nr:cation transport protein-domain-containing protein [Exophiala viscosa]KAI1624176.1 cation transport protein-domain-containing protein [Exophiala viscosa]